MRPMQIRRAAEEIPGDKPGILLNATPSDAILAVRKLELHFTLQHKCGNASSLEHYYQEKSMIHIRTAPRISFCASNKRHGAALSIRRRRLGRLPGKLYYHCG